MKRFSKRLTSCVAALALMAAPLFVGAQSITYPGTLVQQTSTLGASGNKAQVSANFGILSCTVNVGSGLAGTITFKIASDAAGTNFASYAFTPQGGGTAVTSTTSSGVFQASFVAPVTACQAVVTSYSSGSAIVTTIGASRPGGGMVNVTGAFPTPIPFPTFPWPVSLPTSFQTAFPTPIPFPTQPYQVNCVSGCATPPPIQPISLPTSFQTAFPTPIPFPTPNSGTILTSASATTCTNIQASAGKGIEIINSGPATAVFPQFYNDSGATCASATLLYGDGSTITIGAGQIIRIDFPVSGIAYKLSGSLTSNLSVTGL